MVKYNYQKTHEVHTMNYRILIVEDDMAIADALAIHLKYAGYDYEVFHNGLDVVDALTSDHNYDLALLDIMLPGIDGFQLFHHMETYKIPVIYMTTKTDSESEIQCLRSGAEDYITKPFHTMTLLVRIEDLTIDMLSTSANNLPDKWQDEYVKVLIHNSDIIDISWIEPYENIICTQEKVSLLTFPTITYLFEQTVLTQADIYNSQTNSGWNTYFQVTSIELGMMKVSTDTNETSKIVPVWNFRGNVTVSDEDATIEDVTSNLNLLTINAITGTIVNSMI